MYSINIVMSPNLQNFLNRYPQLYEEAKKKGINKTLDLLQQTSFRKAPYKTGTLRREIKQDYNRLMLLAGTDQSKDYALIQDVGGMAGRNRTAKITGRQYFFANAEEQTQKAANIFVDSFKQVFARL